RPEGRGLHAQQTDDGGHRGEAEGEHEWGHDRGGGTETGGTLDEAAEEPTDDDRLDTAVGADVGEGSANGGDGAALGEGGEQEQRTEDDVQQAEGEDQALKAGGRHGRPLGVPEVDGDTDDHDVAGGHRVHGG